MKNRVTAAAYAARVCGLRIWAVKKSTVRAAVCGPERRSVVRAALDLPAPGHDERFRRCGHRCRGDGLRPPRVRAAAPGVGGGSVVWCSPSHNSLYGTLANQTRP